MFTAQDEYSRNPLRVNPPEADIFVRIYPTRCVRIVLREKKIMTKSTPDSKDGPYSLLIQKITKLFQGGAPHIKHGLLCISANMRREIKAVFHRVFV